MRTAIILLVVAFTAGCELSRIESRVTPGRSLSEIHRVYVERSKDEDWGFHNDIADELAAAGFRASAGEAGSVPVGTQAIVTYYDHWFWDMSPYLLELDLRLIDPKDRSVIAWAKDRRTSLVRQSPKFMARECIAALLNAPVMKVNQSSEVEKLQPRQTTARQP